MHKFHMKTLTVSCALALVGGCAFLNHTSPTQFAVAPVTTVTHGASITDANYQIGRSYQASLQYPAAIAAYRKSLEVNPGNAEAHNALGVIYASQGKHEQAVAELMAALALAPAAHIHNNLGYAYLLQGRNADALAALKVASGLDPDNEVSRENIKIAEDRLGREARNPAKAPVATVGAELNSPPTERNGDHSTARLVSIAPNIFELRQESSIQVKPSLPLVTKTTKGTLETVRLEVANGNGVTGLVKRTTSSLQQRGYVVARLTNQVPYTQMITEIQYRQGQENQAKRLNALLSIPAELVESSQLNPSVSVRLVLGRDVVQRSLFNETKKPQFDIVKLKDRRFNQG